jgi:hypothetical protein
MKTMCVRRLAMIKRIGMLALLTGILCAGTACIGPTDPSPLPPVAENQRR